MASTLTYNGTLTSNNWGYFYVAPNGGVAGYWWNIITEEISFPGAQSSIPTSTDYEAVPTPATFNENAGITSSQERLKNVLGVESAQQGTPAINGPTLTAQGAVQNQAFWKWE
jgi:hypothetical protein